MNNSNSNPAEFGRPWASEAFMEAGLAVAAACFTVALWWTSDAGTQAQHQAMMKQGQADSVRHVTFAPVSIVASAIR
jgi:hypothetical protein